MRVEKIRVFLFALVCGVCRVWRERCFLKRTRRSPTELAQTTAAKLGAAQARVEAELAEAKRGLGMD